VVLGAVSVAEGLCWSLVVAELVILLALAAGVAAGAARAGAVGASRAGAGSTGAVGVGSADGGG